MRQRSAHSWTVSRACFLVPTKSTVPPPVASSPANLRAFSSSASVCSRSMMWIPSISPKMKRRMFGFQRRVWWPKWTPASSRSLSSASGILILLFRVKLPAPLAGTWGWPGRIRSAPKRGLVWTVDCRAGALLGVGRLQSGGEVRRQLGGEAEPLAAAWVRKGEPVGVEELPGEAVALGASVGGIAGERVADRREVGADLMGAAGLQARLQVGLPGQQLQHL